MNLPIIPNSTVTLDKVSNGRPGRHRIEEPWNNDERRRWWGWQVDDDDQLPSLSKFNQWHVGGADRPLTRRASSREFSWSTAFIPAPRNDGYRGYAKPKPNGKLPAVEQLWRSGALPEKSKDEIVREIKEAQLGRSERNVEGHSYNFS